MKIIIPMSGFGERFRRAGFSKPKPLIEVEGKPIIAHVIDMFPNEYDFIFICNQEHLDELTYGMEAILKKYCPTGKIVGIKPHKLGPINAVRQVAGMLNPYEPVVVNYCDFTCYWNWYHFKKFVKETGCAGAIPAYRGFHPHSLGKTNYAYIREKDGWAYDIQEKQHYTKNRMDEYASSGTYYFASTEIMLDAFQMVMEQNYDVGGEYYVSLAYKALFAKDQHVAVYPLQHFMQWGTPEDVAEYNTWSKAFKNLLLKPSNSSMPQGTVVMPMAGLGQRFSDEGYTLTKPLIPVSGLPMVIQATQDLPLGENYVFVMRADIDGYKRVVDELEVLYPNAIFRLIDSVTEGQACTVLLGLNALEEDMNEITGPITFGACDNGTLYDVEAFNKIIKDQSVDVIVWGVRQYPNAIRNPNMYGWINADAGLIQNVSVKKPLNEPGNDPIVIGVFTFRKSKDFRRSFDRLIKRSGRVNGEFYIDSLINDAIALGLHCHLFEVDSYLCWGTPNDLNTFEYWQSCFHKWSSHPYRLEHDRHVPKDQIKDLELKYQPLIPEIPKEFV